MKSNIALEVVNLYKTFHLPVESGGLKHSFISLMKGVKGYKEQKVIEDISFTVEKGDFLGIVGRNGSGKSTLLKLLSGIYTPDSGSVLVNGTMVSFIELGVGFDGNLTGRENLYLNGALFGFSNQEMDDMYDEIVDFAELHDFMDQKLKNYSSGMQVRLAFAIAIRARADILVLDEVLAVGDEAFQKKCNDYFEKITKDKSKTVILVTHGMENIRKYCNKAILISDGKIKYSGSPDDVASQYSLENLLSVEEDEFDGDISIKPISSQMIKSSDKLEFEIKYKTTEDRPVYVGISLWSGDTPLFSDSTKDMYTSKKGNYKFKYSYDTKEVGGASIKVTASLYDLETGDLIAYSKEGPSSYFKIRNRENYGLFINKGKWV